MLSEPWDFRFVHQLQSGPQFQSPKRVEEMETSRIRWVAFLFLMPWFGYCQTPEQHHRTDLSKQAEIPVQGLYQQLVFRPIGGIPTPKEIKVLSPYLSGSLVHRIEQAGVCRDDWFRLHPKNGEKAPSTWTEFGLFSGADDRGHPQAFQIERLESKDNGSFRAYVRLTEGPREKPWHWEVVAIVIRENGRFAIDDVIFLKDKDFDTESRLSEILKQGCGGSHCCEQRVARCRCE